MTRRLQVFISSTYKDLILERQAAVTAVLKAGHIPAGMELFTAADRSQMETIKRWIDESDVYMLILGGRYGSIEPSSELSYTELEYDYAVQQSKPLFAVVIEDNALEDKVKNGGLDYIEKENPKQLKAFREKVLSNISAFFEDSKDIRLCVHESLSELAKKRNLKGWVRADEVADTKPLTDEIDRLLDENRQLKESLDQAQKQVSAQQPDAGDEFKEIMEILRATKITIPRSIFDDSYEEIDLYSLVYRERNIFIDGISSSYDDLERIIINNVCPTFILYDLMTAINGYRCLTPKGKELLRQMDKQFVLSARNPIPDHT